MMGISLLLDTVADIISKNIKFSAKTNPHETLESLPLLELSSICINLTLVLVLLFIVSERQIVVCLGRIRVDKEGSNGNSVPIRHNLDGNIQNIVIGRWYKALAFCCFYVLLLQVLVLGFDGIGLIRESARGKSINWTLVLSPAAQSLAWFLLRFSTLHCKFSSS